MSCIRAILFNVTTTDNTIVAIRYKGTFFGHIAKYFKIQGKVESVSSDGKRILIDAKNCVFYYADKKDIDTVLNCCLPGFKLVPE